ncbi:MAG: EAL domain-containing protein [Proteobacteria bacterium]|nr:EAL domain-containing protein [Pseudomonadota bacterium]
MTRDSKSGDASLRTRLSLAFALVALLVAGLILLCIAAPSAGALARVASMIGMPLAGTALAGAIGWRISRRIGARLAALEDMAAAIVRGDYDRRLPVQPADEIGRVGVAFNEMAHRLATACTERSAHQQTLRNEIAERTQTLAEAAERRAHLLDQAEELALIGSSEYDIETGLVQQSDGMFRIFGAPPSDSAVNGEWLMARVPASENAFVRGMLECARPDVPCEFEHRIQHADGSMRTVLHRAVAVGDAHGTPVRIISLLQDITAQRAAERQRDQFANSDSVTRLPNRAALLGQLDAAIRQSQREERQIGLLMIKIDRLKLVTESFGHAAGDRLLRLAAERVIGVAGSRDVVAHLGAGCYALLPNRTGSIDENEARAVGHALVEAFTTPFIIEDTEVTVACAIGIAFSQRDPGSAEELLHQAQAAMYRAAEREGRGVCTYSAGANAKAGERLALEAALRRALQRGEFRLAYQPQMDLATGDMVGVEALLRWRDPLRQVDMSPAEFVPLAETTGMIVPIGTWVLRAACAQNAAWQRAGLKPIRMAVNLSMRQLQQPDIAQLVQATLLEHGLDPRWLGLEITESVLMAESDHVARALGELRTIGVEISIDDFGTGYSNLSYLRTLPIDTVKIDRSCIHDVTAGPNDVSMTRAVIMMAHSLQLRVLAEGVETEGQLALLSAHKCDQIQGYFFSRPIDGDAVAAMLRERSRLPDRLLQRRRGQRTLLVVDATAEGHAAIEQSLRRDGYAIVGAGSGEGGLLQLAEHAVDVVVCTQRLPGMSGVEFLRRAARRCPETIRILLADDGMLDSIAAAVADGAIHKFLARPCDDEALRGHVKDAFRRRELADENRHLDHALQTANQELASVRERLERVIEARRERSSQAETTLGVLQDLVQNIPAALIGIDRDGMIAFANADAAALFADVPALVGRRADEALPRDVLDFWASGGDARADVGIDGKRFLVASRSTHGSDRERGTLLVLTPAAVLAERPAIEGCR